MRSFFTKIKMVSGEIMSLLFKFCITINIFAGTVCLFAENWMGVLLNFGLALWNTGVLEFVGGDNK